MESYKDLLGAGRTSSSESGWTMYIASPYMEEEDAERSDNHDGDHHDKHQIRINRKHVKKEDDDSDDSLTSDASSVPSYRRHTHSRGQVSHGTSRSKPDKSYNENCIFSLGKDAEKQAKKRVGSSTKK
ncbi:protein SOB FIVE-LIKE 4-like [Juglans microcarpa x Juglans regia]|uniref:protein SOB FIVE-LIKE 4-like n=1 Tax=Juglans microcarpa x Juglans regia TaxID=2249226 RepID=UPI001B7E85C9|nr:protein SOB FIVE-LIKE 4-like [Juglans microcarpa x Juglans regia]